MEILILYPDRRWVDESTIKVTIINAGEKGEA